MRVLEKIRESVPMVQEHPEMRLSGENRNEPHNKLREQEKLRRRYLALRRPVNYSELVLKQFSLLETLSEALAKGEPCQEEFERCQKRLAFLREKEGAQVAALLEARRSLKSGEGQKLLAEADALLEKYER